MISPFFLPVHHLGHKFDRGCILFELDAMREPEKTRFPKIGEYIAQRGIKLVQIPKPQVVYRDPMPFDGLRYMPDFFISNDTKAWLHAHHVPKTSLHPSLKHAWGNDVDYEVVSLINHPRGMHDAFETWCQKLYGFGLNRIVAKYHRAAWLPLYWPESLGTIWPTKFHYPQSGYAGEVAEVLGTTQNKSAVKLYEQVDIGTAYCLGRSAAPKSVLFVLDRNTPIYRITDQTVCSGGTSPIHKLVVEFREEPANIERDLSAYGYTVENMVLGRGKLVPPTRENVEAGYDFGNHMNKQIWGMMNATASA